MRPVGTDGLAEVTVGRIDYTFCLGGSRLMRQMTRMTTEVEESCEAIVAASDDGHVRLTLRPLLPRMIPQGGDLDASDSLCSNWNW